MMIPPNFRKLAPSQRRKILKAGFQLEEDELLLLANQIDLSELADTLVESSIGTFPIPLGIASHFQVDKEVKLVPMATEEPSVIAAASFAACLIKRGGGFTTWAEQPVMTAQVYIKDTPQDRVKEIYAHAHTIQKKVDQLIPRMVARGGGYRGISVEWKDQTLVVSIDVDVRDAMGANVLNSVAENMKNYLRSLCGGRILMAILTNSAAKKIAGASFTLPAKYLKRGNISGEEACQRIVEANAAAQAFPSRAITHNKGVMNGIAALALATGNDTRACEAAVHFHAQKTGKYLPLTQYTFENHALKGSIELPLALGTIGGATQFWPASRCVHKILGNPDAASLNRLAASVGLAQNLAALFALVTDGILEGHMKLHTAKQAYTAGARGQSARHEGALLWKKQQADLKHAAEPQEKRT